MSSTTAALPTPTAAVPKPQAAAKKDKRRSLGYKFGISITLMLTTTIIFISFLALQGEQAALRQEMEQRGITIARNLAINSSKLLLRNELLEMNTMVKDAMSNKGVMYAVLVDENSMIVASDQIAEASKVYRPQPGTQVLGNKTLAVSDPFYYKNTKTVDIAVQITIQDQAKLGEVHIGLSQTPIEEAIQKALMQISGVAIFFIVVGILITLILVSIITRPIKSLEKGAEIIGHGNLDYTIQVKSNDEIGNLARSFNRMTTDLKSAQANLIEKEKMEQELETARKIQAVLLPKADPVIPGFQIVSFYKSAKEVGGDYYDFHTITENLLGLTVADVSGKGVPGSLGMVMTRSILRSQIHLADAYQTLCKTNGLLFKDIKRGMFVTMFHAIIDLKNKTVDCANAGHNPLILAHANGEVELFNPGGIALGLDKGDRFNSKMQSMSIPLKPGDAFILYTDGVTEAMNTKEEEFTEDRLAAVLGRNVNLNAAELRDTIIAELDNFTQGAAQHDDITLLTIKLE